MTTNHSSMTGPKSRPTFCVPNRCATNSTTRMPTPIGSTALCTLGETTSMPSTADSTEMAGVMTLSPKNSAAPNMPSRTAMATTRWAATRCRIRAASAMMPPSPSLSARSMNATYFTDTIDQDRPEHQRDDPVDVPGTAGRRGCRWRRPSAGRTAGWCRCRRTPRRARRGPGAAPATRAAGCGRVADRADRLVPGWPGAAGGLDSSVQCAACPRGARAGPWGADRHRSNLRRARRA